MNPLLDAALDVQSFCQARRWRHCIIGALAVQRWGEPRLTQDVDVTVISGFGPEATFVDALLAQYRGRIPDARDFALRHRDLLLETVSGIHVDLSLGGVPFEERVIERASGWDVGAGEALVTCSAEDLVVLKAFAGRDKDWLDIAGVVTRQGVALDASLVLGELRPLLDLREDVKPLERLRALMKRDQDR